jgi:phosphoglycerol transferase MdoB-like AlkP superfamily enzyme
MPSYVRLLFRLLLIGLLIGQVFRLTLLMLHRAEWADAPAGDVWRAIFDRGLLFDLYIIAWSLAIPALLLGVSHALGRESRTMRQVARWFFTVPLLIFIFLGCADIPYFDYTHMRLTDAVLITLHDPGQAFIELVSTPAYIATLLVFGSVTWLVVRGIGRLFAATPFDRPRPLAVRWAMLPLPLLLLFLGMRGTADPDQHPLSAQDAFFSGTPILNQLGTNAAFSFFESLGQDHVELMSEDEALARTRELLGITEESPWSPIARWTDFTEPPRRHNVVLVLVESLSAQRLHRYGHPAHLMPFLEGLMDSSLVMDRFYSSGMHTANGIFSTLYGLPPLGAQHPMMHPSMLAQRFIGLPGTLKAHGYRTCFIGPGDPRFDNMHGFLPANGFDAFIAEPDFPATDARNSWGVTDQAVYRMALRRADELAADDAPFFMTLLTVSSHKWTTAPTDIPGFTPTSSDDEEAVYEYADRALELFFREVRGRAWSDSTVFVVLGDHGQAFDPRYEVPLAYHHVPLVVHAPHLVEPGTLPGYGMQTDVPTTVLSLLRLPHWDNTLGRDLLQGGHRAAFFCSDHRICAINDHGYRIRDRTTVRMYDHANGSTTDIAVLRPELCDSLGVFAESMVQAAQALVRRKQVAVDAPLP